jgi:hypothetical protein
MKDFENEDADNIKTLYDYRLFEEIEKSKDTNEAINEYRRAAMNPNREVAVLEKNDGRKKKKVYRKSIFKDWLRRLMWGGKKSLAEYGQINLRGRFPCPGVHVAAHVFEIVRNLHSSHPVMLFNLGESNSLEWIRMQHGKNQINQTSGDLDFIDNFLSLRIKL